MRLWRIGISADCTGYAEFSVTVTPELHRSVVALADLKTQPCRQFANFPMIYRRPSLLPRMPSDAAQSGLPRNEDEGACIGVCSGYLMAHSRVTLNLLPG